MKGFDCVGQLRFDPFFSSPDSSECNDLLFLSKLKIKQEKYSYHVRVRKLALKSNYLNKLQIFPCEKLACGFAKTSINQKQ